MRVNISGSICKIVSFGFPSHIEKCDYADITCCLLNVFSQSPIFIDSGYAVDYVFIHRPH